MGAFTTRATSEIIEGDLVKNKVLSIQTLIRTIQPKSFFFNSPTPTGAIRRRPREPRIGSESDLVVDDDVDAAVSRVKGEIGQVKGLEHDSLAGECGITM